MSIETTVQIEEVVDKGGIPLNEPATIPLNVIKQLQGGKLIVAFDDAMESTEPLTALRIANLQRMVVEKFGVGGARELQQRVEAVHQMEELPPRDINDGFTVFYWRKHDEVPDEEIARLYKEGLSAEKIGEKYGLGINAVLKRLHEQGINTPWGGHREYDRATSKKMGGPRRADISDQELKRLYVIEKLSSETIGEICGCNYQTVIDRLRMMGVEIRPIGPVPLELPDDEIVRLYTDEKLGIYQIAERFGVNHETIRRRLEAQGIDRRTQGTRWEK